MIDIGTKFLKRLSYSSALEITPASHPHKIFATIAWILAVITCSGLYFLIYHYPVGLHDVSHYITAGVSQVRDHKDLLYPYTPGEQGGPAYEYFQDNNIRFDMRTNYPSKLYSTLYGLIYAVTGEMHFIYAQWLALGALIACNILLYLIGSRFFTGAALFCFIVAVVFLPVMRFALVPGSDVFGYLAGLFVIWLCVCCRVNPFAVGLAAGVLCHFRSQSLSIVVALPFIISPLYGRTFFRQALVPLVAGAALTYAIVALLYKILIFSGGTSNPIAFYINSFSSSFYRPDELLMVGDKFASNVISVFDKTQLFFFAYVSLICISLKKLPVQRGFAIAAWAYLAVPLVIYSLDRSAPSQARYYIFAVPILVLAWFIAVKNFNQVGLARPGRIMAITAALICLDWYSVQGLPLRRTTTFDIISSRLKFFDFQGVETALRDNFNEDDLVIVNHSLPTGLSRLHNVVYIPSFADFKVGDNREFDGMVFVYADQSPNDFFKPLDWMVDGEPPDEIKDDQGVVFKKTYSAISEFPGFDGSLEAKAHFYIYKNSNPNRSLSRDAEGKRTFHAQRGSDLSTLRIASPTFDDATVWGHGFQRDGAGRGVLVGPGPNNATVLSQRFAVLPGEKFKITAKISAVGTADAKGRIQVNWLGENDRYISTSFKVIDASRDEHSYTALIVAPAGATTGMVYVSPHGLHDIVRYTEMSVMGK